MRMKKWLALIIVVLVLLAGWIAAGPFLAINGIRQAVKAQDAAALSEYIDFPAVRTSLKQQVDDYVVRRAGADVQSSLLGSIALQLASGATDGIVDMMATPAGLAAVMEGRNFWHRVSGQRASENTYATAPARDPLEGAKYRYESTSRFTATLDNADGDPVVFVLTRDGLTWKVTEVRVPLAAMVPGGR
jgi:hypothetical protein